MSNALPAPPRALRVPPGLLTLTPCTHLPAAQHKIKHPALPWAPARLSWFFPRQSSGNAGPRVAGTGQALRQLSPLGGGRSHSGPRPRAWGLCRPPRVLGPQGLPEAGEGLCQAPQLLTAVLGAAAWAQEWVKPRGPQGNEHRCPASLRAHAGGRRPGPVPWCAVH